MSGRSSRFSIPRVNRLPRSEYNEYVGIYAWLYKPLAVVCVPLFIIGCLMWGLGSGDTLFAGLSIFFISVFLLLVAFLLSCFGGEWRRNGKQLPEGVDPRSVVWTRI